MLHIDVIVDPEKDTKKVHNLSKDKKLSKILLLGEITAILSLREKNNQRRQVRAILIVHSAIFLKIISTCCGCAQTKRINMWWEKAPFHSTIIFCRIFWCRHLCHIPFIKTSLWDPPKSQHFRKKIMLETITDTNTNFFNASLSGKIMFWGKDTKQ